MPTTDEQFLTSLLTGRGLTEEAAHAALAGMEGNDAQPSPKAVHGAPRAARRREKMFGMGRPRALDRNAKVRIMHWARCLSRRTEKGRAYGGQNKSSAKSYAKGERSMNCAVVRKPRHPIPVDCHRIGPDLISSSARLDNSPGRLVVRGVGRWVTGSFSRLKID